MLAYTYRNGWAKSSTRKNSLGQLANDVGSVTEHSIVHARCRVAYAGVITVGLNGRDISRGSPRKPAKAADIVEVHDVRVEFSDRSAKCDVGFEATQFAQVSCKFLNLPSWATIYEYVECAA